MTEPVPGEVPVEAPDHDEAPPFAPIYTLVNNSSTQTTHHPHVQYFFSDDDPDHLTQAIAQQHDANLQVSGSDPASVNRAVLLDLARDADGTVNVAWASSLSPSWAVLDAQLTQISPPSSDGENGSPTSDKKKPQRLMLRVEGVDSSSSGEGDLRLSGEGSRQGSGIGGGSGSGSGLGSGSGQQWEDYDALVQEFDKKMSSLKKVVDAGEERMRKMSAEAEEEPTAQEAAHDAVQDQAAHDAAQDQAAHDAAQDHAVVGE